MAGAKGARTGALLGSELLTNNEAKVSGTLGQGFTQAGNSLTQGRDAAQGWLGQAQQGYAGMQTMARPGVDQLTGFLTGDAASQNAALEGSNAYQWNTDQTIKGLNRSRAARGMLNSGNTDADTMQMISGLASQTRNSEIQNLLPFLGMYQQGVQGEAGVYGQQAQNASGYFGNQAALTTDYFGNLASVQDSTAKDIVGLHVGALKAGDAAKAANQNMMLGAASSVAGLLGSAMGGGGGAGGFTKLFGK